MASRLPWKQAAPRDQADASSTLSMWTWYLPGSVSTSFLQPTGRAWEVGSLTRMVCFTRSPEMLLAMGKTVVCALRVGRPPTALAVFMRTLVPRTESAPFFGLGMGGSEFRGARAALWACLK